MERSLHGEGYTIYAVEYSCFGADIAACGRHLAREAAWLRDATGCASANVVAHSLGGVVLRWALAHTWMRDWVNVAVTLGSPHRGTPTACLAPHALPGLGKIIGQLRPRNADIRDAIHHSLGGATRWIAVGSEQDWVVPPNYARLPDSENVRNITVSWGGHLALPNNKHCLQIVLEELAAARLPDDHREAA
nr:hypothetical protein [Pedococcus sp. 5OH_020]